MMAYEKTSYKVEDSQNDQLEKEKKEEEERIAKTPSMKQFSYQNELLNKRQKQEKIRSTLAQKLRDEILESIRRNRDVQLSGKGGESDSEDDKEGLSVQKPDI